MCGCVLHAPHWGAGPQPRHVPWLGIEPPTLQFTGWHSIHWTTPDRAGDMFQFLSIYLGVGLLSHLVRSYQTVFHSSHATYIPTSNVEGWNFSIFSSTLVIIYLFHYTIWSQCVNSTLALALICLFLMATDVEHLFMFQLAISIHV